MKSKIIIILMIGFIAGILVWHFWPIQSGTSEHWQAIRKHNAYMRDPANYKPVPGTKVSMATPPCDPMPHLAALVAVGELKHVDLVFPTVPYSNRDATRYWMKFCEQYTNEILYASGNPSYVAFSPKGEQPIHLNIWYTDSGEKLIQQLIRELEQIGTNMEPTIGRTVSVPCDESPSGQP